MEHHHFQWVNQLFLWPFSIANYVQLPEGSRWDIHSSMMFARSAAPSAEV